MKTALQELIDDLRELKKHSKDNKQDTSFDIGMTFAIARAELRLEVEKRQIIEAYIAERYVLAGGHPVRIDQAEDYYNRTYK
jgi:hypothetical protein